MSKQYHIHLEEGQVGRYVLLPGDPGRVPTIANFLEDPHPVASNREYTTWNGTMEGELVSVVSTGIGCPSTAIAVEELVAIGAETLIRVGTAGRLSPLTEVGDFVVATSAIRDEGTSKALLPLEFPAAADPLLSMSLHNGAQRALRELRKEESFTRRLHLGTTQSKDAFYGQQHSVDRGPLGRANRERLEAWKAAGTLCSEMEAATLYILASLRGVRASSLLSLGGHPEGEAVHELEAERLGDQVLGQVAVAALAEAIRADKTSFKI